MGLLCVSSLPNYFYRVKNSNTKNGFMMQLNANTMLGVCERHTPLSKSKTERVSKFALTNVREETQTKRKF